MKGIYFLGICGAAMGNVALLLKQSGYRVAGSDSRAYPPMNGVLKEAGIEFRLGFDEGHLRDARPDLVVVGNSIVRGNPEMEWLLSKREIPFVSLPGLISTHLLKRRRNIVVTGTHGKTTTATLTAVLLRAAGRDPGFLIGGVPLDLPCGAHLGAESDPFVIEGDEYDSALFDKRSKFVHYPPSVATINNIEFDHADIFRDLQDVQRSFNHFLKILPADGFLLLNGDDPNIAALAPISWGTVWRVGTGEGNDLVIRDFSEDASGSEFGLHWRGCEWAKVRWPIGGLCNARNAAMAALAVAAAMHPNAPSRLDLAALATFRGVKRRQEKLLERPGLTVIEDFAHHPTAVREILFSFRSRYPGKTRIVAFEPRTNTTRRRVAQEDLIRALAEADIALIGPIDRLSQLAEEERLDVSAVVAELERRGVRARHFESNAALLEGLIEESRAFDRENDLLVTFFTNGSFDGIMDGYVRVMSGDGTSLAPALPGARDPL